MGFKKIDDSKMNMDSLGATSLREGNPEFKVTKAATTPVSFLKKSWQFAENKNL